MQLGTYFEGKVCSWSEAVSFSSSSQEASSNDAEDGLSVPVAFVLGSGDIRGARWSVTSRMYRGIEIISIEQRFYVINNVGRPLLAHPVLVMSGKKVMNTYLGLILRCKNGKSLIRFSAAHPLGSITSRCPGKEPALHPRSHSRKRRKSSLLILVLYLF